MKLLKKKMVLLGDGGVGKTSLINRFVLNKFNEKYIATIGTRVSKKSMVIGDSEVTLMIWDILGQKGYERVQWASFKGAEGAFMVVDVTRRSTLESIEGYWIPQLYKIAPGIPLILLGNKSDLDNWEVQEDDLRLLAEKYNMEYFLTSAKTGENVELAFRKLAEHMLGMNIATGKENKQSKEVRTVKDALDYIIYDFSINYGDINDAMPIVRKQAEKAGVNIHTPDYDSVKKFIDLLEEVERSFKGDEEARELKLKRLKILRKVR